MTGTLKAHRACEGGHENVVEMLLLFGAYTEVVDDSGWTPLWNALVIGHAGCLRLLLAEGSNVSFMYDRMDCFRYSKRFVHVKHYFSLPICEALMIDEKANKLGNGFRTFVFLHRGSVSER